MKIKSRIICLSLVFVFMFMVVGQSVSYVYAGDLDSFEITQIGNIYYMYLENNEDIVCITVNSDGNFVNAYSRKQNIEDKMFEYKPKSTLNLEESILHTNKLLNNEESKFTNTDIIYPYRSLKDYVGEVLISSTGVSDFYYKKTKTSDNLYNNNSAIIKRGCELY